MTPRLVPWELECGHVRHVAADSRYEPGEEIRCFECPAHLTGDGRVAPMRALVRKVSDHA